MKNIKANIFFGSSEVQSFEYTPRVSPYSKDVVSMAAICSESDAKKALQIAKSAARVAKKSLLSQRLQWLEDVASKLEAQKEDFAQTIVDEVAKPITFARAEVQRAIETIRLSIYAAANLHGETIPTDIMPSGKESIAFFKREPVGVVVSITPFNFPLNLVAHKLAPALVAGNAVVLKPTPEAPLTAYKLAKLFIESKYAIKDALSVVYGDAEVGAALVQSPIPRVISFTGSVPVGKTIISQAGIKKVSLELGGNAATYIQKSADLKFAAKRCAFGAFVNSGQVCISLQRIYVDESIYEEFGRLLAEETSLLKVGSPYDEDTFMGPLIDDDANARALQWVNSALKEGAVALCGAKVENGIFYPTVMSEVDDSMEIVCEEVFAPIVSLVKVKDFDEAVKKINASPYGLQFSIFTNDLNLTKRAIEEFEAGGVVINDIPTLRFDVQPYGGVKNSGIGREGPKYALEEFTEIKSIVIN